MAADNQGLRDPAFAALAKRHNDHYFPEGKPDKNSLERYKNVLRNEISAIDPVAAKPILHHVDTILGDFEQDPTNVHSDKLTAREQAFFTIGILVGIDVDGGLHLAVHLYELMAIRGMSPTKVANALRLVQIYEGLSAYTAALRTFEILKREMEKFEDTWQEQDHKRGDFIRHLITVFGKTF